MVLVQTILALSGFTLFASSWVPLAGPWQFALDPATLQRILQ
jgi:hypothetical protein